MKIFEEMPMASPPRYPNTDDDTGVRHDRGSTPSTSRWVYAVGIAVIALVVLLVVLHVTGTVGPVHR